MNQHKWHKEIKAWADGAEIEACSTGIWYSTDYPAWHSGDHQFRIKPQPKKPKYLYVYADGNFFIHNQPPIGAPAHWQYFGKIEVQDD